MRRSGEEKGGLRVVTHRMILYTLHVGCSESLATGSMVSYILGIGGGNCKYVTRIGRVSNLGYTNIFVRRNIPRKPLSL